MSERERARARQRQARARMRSALPQQAPVPSPAGEALQRGLRGAGQIAATTAVGGALELPAAIAGTTAGLMRGDEAAMAALEGVRGLAPELGPEGQEMLKGAFNALPEPLQRALAGASERFGQFSQVAEETFGEFPATAAPSVLGGFAGFAAGKQIMRAANKAQLQGRKEIARGLTESLPSIEDLRLGAKEIYTEIDNLGVRLPTNVMTAMNKRLEKALSRVEPESRGSLAPISSSLVSQIRSATGKGDDVMLSVLQNQRDIINLKMPDVSKGGLDESIIMDLRDIIDDTIDGIKVVNLPEGKGVGERLRMARELMRRSKRAEVMQEALERAQRTASGFENGLRNELKRLVNNPRQKKFFKKEELAAMDAVIKGDKKTNMMKFLGKFGMMEGRATTATSTALGSLLGLNIFGGPGGVIFPMIGQVTKGMAQRLTARGFKAADELIRAGNDGPAIVEIYLRTVPPAARNPRDLASLLVRPDIEVGGIPPSNFNREAIQLVQQARTKWAERIAKAGRAAPLVGAGLGAFAGGQLEQLMTEAQP